MPLTVGTLLGAYRILAPIGAGGMGEVYRAHDTKLERDVAIKVLPRPLAQDPDRLARFEREAKVLASLNHPNIAQIYGLEESADLRALVMELVPGETLASLLKGGPLPLETALHHAKDIADALEAAHERGITHRDLKPANAMVTPAGVVKVLDFGLAAVAPASAGDPQAEACATLTIGATQAGAIMGTAAYMSPEQAVGKPVDRRADIWSFGVVLFEMLTGQRMFTGETVSHVLADVIRAQIDFAKLPPQTPAAIRALLERCLDRDLRNRLQWIGEARITIQKCLADPSAGTLIVEQSPPAPQPRAGLGWKIATVATVLATLALCAVAYRHVTEEPPRVLKVSVLPPEKGAIDAASVPALSPDGRRLAFRATVDGKGELWVRDLDSLSARPLPGTEGAYNPFWSPDSRTIAFFTPGKLKKVDVTGGPALTLCDAPQGRGGTWSKEDVIVFADLTAGGLSRLPAAGGTATRITDLDRASGETSHRWPWFLPDGRHFLYTATNVTGPEKTAVYVAELGAKGRRSVLAAASNVLFAPPGYLLFVRERTLMAQPFDVAGLKTTGDAVPIAEQVDFASGNARAEFSASQSGVLAYSAGGSSGNAQATWLDRSGKVLGTVGAPGDVQWPMISPDGSTVALNRRDPQTGTIDIWLHDLKRGTASRFTLTSQFNGYPVWSPDGSHIAFYSTRDGIGHVFQKATSGAAQDEVLDKALDDPPVNTRADDWSRDGRYLIEQAANNSKTKGDIWVLPLSPDKSGDRKAFPYLHTEFNEALAKLSPNGQWLAYSSDETKRAEVYVQTFPNPGGKWQISTNGGNHPVWSRDGKELFFISADQKMMALEIKAVETKNGSKFEAGVPKPLFDARLDSTNSWFDVSKDGRFLIPVPTEQAASTPLTVVVNWTDGLKK